MTEAPLPFDPEPQLPELQVDNQGNVFEVIATSADGSAMITFLRVLWQKLGAKRIKPGQLLRGGTDGR